MVEMTNVESSNIKSIGFDEEKHILYVRFVGSTRLYCYENVLKEVFDAFTIAESKGKFFFENIKNKYAYFVID